jgi:RNA recognition motif-containing protein
MLQRSVLAASGLVGVGSRVVRYGGAGYGPLSVHGSSPCSGVAGVTKRSLHFTIFIKGLPHTVTDDTLRQTFESYGPIKQGKYSLESHGCSILVVIGMVHVVSVFSVNEQYKSASATIQFLHAASAMAAVDDMDEKVILHINRF